MKTLNELKEMMVQWAKNAIQKTTDTQYCICYKGTFKEYMFMQNKHSVYDRILIGIEYYNPTLKKQCFAESIALNSRDNWEAYQRALKNLAVYQPW